jgi:PKD repeat protein
MNANDFYTRRVLGMDYRVWATMLVISLLSLGLFGYRHVIHSGSSRILGCTPDTISVNGTKIEVLASCYLDRYSPFAISSDGPANVEWDFGDDTESQKGQVVNHKFVKEGTYRIIATVNKRCIYEGEVEVIEDPFYSARRKKPVVEIFADPMRPTSGSSVKFYCVSDIPTITSYKWTVLNTNEIQNIPEPTFTFNNDGNYDVQLLINNNESNIWKTVIQVSSRPPQIPAGNTDVGLNGGSPVDVRNIGRLVTSEVTPAANDDKPQNNNGINNERGNKTDSIKNASVHKAPELDEAAFKDLLQNVVNQEGKELEDLYEYLDYKASTRVEVNKSSTLISLKEFCQNMRGKKKSRRKIEALSFKIDDKKSIQTIQVKIPPKEGFFERLNPFN